MAQGAAGRRNEHHAIVLRQPEGVRVLVAVGVPDDDVAVALEAL